MNRRTVSRTQRRLGLSARARRARSLVGASCRGRHPAAAAARSLVQMPRVPVQLFQLLVGLLFCSADRQSSLPCSTFCCEQREPTRSSSRHRCDPRPSLARQRRPAVSGADLSSRRVPRQLQQRWPRRSSREPTSRSSRARPSRPASPSTRSGRATRLPSALTMRGASHVSPSLPLLAAQLPAGELADGCCRVRCRPEGIGAGSGPPPSPP